MIAPFPLTLHLRVTEDLKQTIVNGELFLILGRQLNNSSMSCPEYMRPIWSKI